MLTGEAWRYILRNKDRWLLRMTTLGKCWWYQSDQCDKLSECFPKDPPEIVAPKACIYFPGSLWLFSRRVTKQEPKKASAPRRPLEWGIQEEICYDWQNALKKRVFNKKLTLN